MNRTWVDEMRHQTEVEIDNYDLFCLKGGVYYTHPIIHTLKGQSQDLELGGGSINKKNHYETSNKHLFSINKPLAKTKTQKS